MGDSKKNVTLKISNPPTPGTTPEDRNTGEQPGTVAHVCNASKAEAGESQVEGQP